MEVDGKERECSVPLLVTLVHGTWGRSIFPSKTAVPRQGGTRWFEERGSFRLELETELKKAGFEPIFHAHCWSGTNSAQERYNATQSLGRHIEEQSNKQKGVKHLLVGHSHGGNVCLRASLAAECDSKTLVATMATPFVESRRAYENIYSAELFEAVVKLFFLVLIVPIFWMFLADFIHRNVLREAWAITHIASFIFVPVVGFMAVMLAKRVTAPFVAEPKLLEVPFDTIKSVVPHRQSLVELLVLRGIDDEASLVLSVGALGSRLSSRLFRVCLSVGAIAVGLSSLIIAIATLIGVDKFKTAAVLAGVFYVSAIILALAGLFASIFKIAYGRDYWFGIFNTLINAHSTPDSSCAMHVVTLPREEGMRHSLYLHTRVANIISIHAKKWAD